MQTNHFIKLFSAELESFEEDIRELEALCGKRLRSMEITNYVFRENDALMKHEIGGIRSIHKKIEKLDPDSFATLDDVFNAVITLAEETVKEQQFPEAVLPVIRRRAEKIRDFVSGS